MRANACLLSQDFFQEPVLEIDGPLLIPQEFGHVLGCRVHLAVKHRHPDLSTCKIWVNKPNHMINSSAIGIKSEEKHV